MAQWGREDRELGQPAPLPPREGPTGARARSHLSESGPRVATTLGRGDVIAQLRLAPAAAPL